jgi:hypothetical protein
MCRQTRVPPVLAVPQPAEALAVEGVVGARRARPLHPSAAVRQGSLEAFERRLDMRSIGLLIFGILICVGTSLGVTPKVLLELRLGDTSPRPGLSEMVFPGSSQPVFLSNDPVITNADITCARATTHANAPAVEVTLIKTAAQKFCEITGATLGKPIGVFVDGKLVNVATIREKFCDGRVTITGSFSLDEARRIAEAFPEGPPDALRVNSVRWVHELIELINSGNRKAAWTYAQRNFSPDFLKIPKEEHLNFISVTHDLTRGVESHGLQDCTANGVTALLKNKLTGSWLALDVAVEPQAPYRISGIALRPSQPPSFKQPAKKLTDARFVKELKAFMQTLVEADVFSGAVLLAQNGKPIFKQAYGEASKEFHVPNRVDTKFNLGSMNKMFTSVAIAQLVEQGKMSFDDALSSFLPNFPDESSAKKIRIKHLLTHTSGLGNYFTEEFFNASRARFRTVDDMMKLVKDDSIQFQPGTRWAYSNTGMLVLGKVIEKVTGESYFDYVRKNIYEPAGMINTDCYELDRVVPQSSTRL